MTMKVWLLLVSYVIGALALAALIWFVGPLVAIAGLRPLDPAWSRWLAIGLIVTILAAAIAVTVVRRRRAEALLAKGLEGEGAEDAEASGDGEVLAERMKDALQTLRKASGAKGDYLYDLPWYMIIGPPGSGKTTALINAGLKFPLARGRTPAAIAGVGGTRYCDWWFTEEAVLIDTAGRYTTQDSDAKGDQKSWLAFLDLLKENRPRQPINGVIVCISLEDLATAGPEAVRGHADAIRARLLELHERLKVDFPVYAMFTKADLVAGFVEFFGHLNETGRRVVWGSTFQTDDKTLNKVGDVADEFDLLVERLNLEMVDRLQDEPAPVSKVQVLSFPSQMAACKPAVVDFLGRIFEPTRYHANATLRGFYFTSGTQLGTPIDRLIGALSRSFGVEERAAGGYSGLGRSYFLTDLITKVIVGEAGWVSTNRAVVRRMGLARGLGFAAIGLGAAALAGAWWVSFQRNSGLIEETFQSSTRYRQIGEDVSAETVIGDGDLSRPLRHLFHLRTMPAGYAQRDEDTPLAETFGLSQRPRLNSAAESTYQAALERHFRPRILYRLESELRSRPQDAAYAYQALPVYLMLGGREPLVKDQVRTFLRNDWEQGQFRGAANADGRRMLAEHLDALMDFDPPTETRAVALDEALIQETQKTLGRMGVIDRAFELIRAGAAQQRARDWTAKARGGQDASRVFEARVGEDLDAARVPFLFTYDGFHEAFLGRLAEVRAQVERERGLMGEVADQQALQRQFDRLEPALLERYGAEFGRAWTQALGALRIRSLTADRPGYVTLDAAARATSPLIALFESIREETQLTRERPKPAGAAPQPAPPPRPAFPQGVVPGADIEASFRAMHVVVEAQGGRRPIDDLIKNLSDIHQSLMAMADPAQAAGAAQTFRTHLQSLRGNATRLPPPFSTMMQTAANSFDSDATGTTLARLGQALAEQVTEPCRLATSGRYPFVRGSTNDMALADFEKLFGTNGMIDRFFAANLAPYADTTRRDWSWNQTHPVGRQLPAALLRDFQRAAAIRETYMRTGAAGFAFVARTMTMPQGVQSARLEVNGAILAKDAPEPPPPPPPQPSALEVLFGQRQQAPPPQPQRPRPPEAPTAMQWPGPAGMQKAAVILVLDQAGRTATLQRDGAWALFRLLEAGTVQRSGETVIATFSVGGRDIAYAINVAAPVNPLTSTLLREFRCPGSR